MNVCPRLSETQRKKKQKHLNTPWNFSTCFTNIYHTTKITILSHYFFSVAFTIFTAHILLQSFTPIHAIINEKRIIIGLFYIIKKNIWNISVWKKDMKTRIVKQVRDNRGRVYREREREVCVYLLSTKQPFCLVFLT